MATVELEGVTKAFSAGSQYCTVEDIGFQVNDGELFCLVGPSNSGKTTTLRLVAGLETPDAGDIRFDDDSVVDVPANERGASLLFEELALYPKRTGAENIGHPLKVAGVPPDDRRDRVEDLAGTLGIEHLLDRPPETFSGGEKQRVGIARTIIKDAAIHLLDEPLEGLDAKLKKSMRVELSRLQHDLGETILYATNDSETAMSVADRMAIIRHGSIVQIGTPLDLYDEPVNRFVANFIGTPSIELVDGRVEDATVHLGPLAVAGGDRVAGLDGTVETVGIRPQDLSLTESPDGATFAGEVIVVEPLGPKSIVDVDLDGLDLRVVTRDLFARDLDRGDPVGVDLEGSDLYLFDGNEDTVLVPER